MKSLLLVAMVLAVALVACNAPMQAPEPCQKSVNYVVYGRNSDVLYQQNTIAELSFGNGQTSTNDRFVQYPMKPHPDFKVAQQRVDRLVDQANRNLAQLFAGPPVTGTGFDFRQERGHTRMDGKVYDRSTACEAANYSVWFGDYLKFFTGDGGYRYRTYIDFVGETAYVTSQLHGSGSKVVYSFPASWFDRAVSVAFEDGGTFALPDTPEFYHERVAGVAITEETLLAAIAGDLEEVAYFSFASDDYEGRKELRPAIIKAMELEFGRSDATEYLFTGRTVANTRVFARATYSGGNFQLSGWQALSFGELEGHGSGGSAESSFSMTTTTVLEGSIYILPTNQ